MASVGRFAEKALSASFYKAQWNSLKTNSYNYYHPLIRQGR
jgi:hypothetical protein